MRKFTLYFALTLIPATLAFAGPEAIQTSSKEMKETVAPAPTCDFSWTGFYIGVRGGYGWDVGDVNLIPLPSAAAFNTNALTTHPDAEGFVGGGELGYNWQINRVVLGVETDLSGSGMDGDSHQSPLFTPGGVPLLPSRFDASKNVDWFGTVRGRIGFVPWCRTLVYGTGGLAYAHVNSDAVSDFFNVPQLHFPASRDDIQFGWTAGAGVEFAMSKHWTIKAEYLYCDVGDDSRTVQENPPLPPFAIRYRWDTQFHTVTAGLNFKF